MYGIFLTGPPLIAASNACQAMDELHERRSIRLNDLRRIQLLAIQKR
jgi:hypothetical protein